MSMHDSNELSNVDLCNIPCISMQNIIDFDYWSALATAPAETSAQAKETFNFNNSSVSTNQK